MEEQVFLKTMVETVKYDENEYDHRDELLGILRNTIIKYQKLGIWSNEPDKSRENIILRVPIPMLVEARKLTKVLEKLASDVYEENTYYAFGALKIKPKRVDLDNEECIEHDVFFDEIKDVIIQGIRNAKYTIWVAVAWFTDIEIFNELMLRKKAGVHVRIITSDENSNQHLMEQLESNFDVLKIALKGKFLSNRLHDKFCIIDLEFVMHGSYNWSKNARYCDETLATALDRDFVRKFADEFIKLHGEN
ncbi:phospholipase D-like domain-containing protein [Clostridium estertheticum]|uniref:phospholipase D-like domain-containing protein n=1 Tax=Clostridium estertheticum TaxID=238834 RepID=UPI001CF112D3|nr:phospholipase D-like domain-containing protein [Clostridium estertheticum]MCB2353922.1 phospholipase D-like domain-containing protein [Clostridium estertheticum]WAG43063.1 phospholipase D-like domain-containing protein [Clostridium estertheticum]